MLFLAFDVGNTAIKCALFDDNTIISNFKIADEIIYNYDDFEKEINIKFIENKIDINNIEQILLSSVVARLTPIIQEFCKNYNKKLFDIKNDKFLSDFDTNVNNGNKYGIGSDILADITYCKSIYEKNFVVIEMGSATVFDVVGDVGSYIGAVFLPGLGLFNKSLSEHIPALPETELKICHNIIGTTTEQCMENGIFFGYIGAIKEICINIKKELKNENIKFILCGGYSHIVKDHLDFITAVEENTVLKGLKIVFDKYGSDL